MQRTVYNVWGRMLRDKRLANERAAKALKDNPKITNLHIAIVEMKDPFVFGNGSPKRIHYQARWYDRNVAIKLAAERRLQGAKREPHSCNCEYCEHGE